MESISYQFSASGTINVPLLDWKNINEILQWLTIYNGTSCNVIVKNTSYRVDSIEKNTSIKRAIPVHNQLNYYINSCMWDFDDKDNVMDFAIPSEILKYDVIIILESYAQKLKEYLSSIENSCTNKSTDNSYSYNWSVEFLQRLCVVPIPKNSENQIISVTEFKRFTRPRSNSELVNMLNAGAECSIYELLCALSNFSNSNDIGYRELDLAANGYWLKKMTERVRS